MSVQLVCSICKQPYLGPTDRYVCPHCGGSIEPVLSLAPKHRELIECGGDASAPGIWRYRDFFPGLEAVAPLSMGEGSTPLQRATALEKAYGISQFYLKNETMNPTGTYKDRFASPALSLYLAEGVSSVAIGSAGNAGCAVAAYSAKAGIPCHVILPDAGLAPRAQQAMAYGARFIRAKGEVNDCIALIEQGGARYGWRNGCTTMLHNPLPSEGYKTLVYEMYLQLGKKLPDVILCPIGGGILISKVYRACCELIELGLTNHIPRLVGVQAAGCPPVVWAFENGENTTPIWQNSKTIASSINDPLTFEGTTTLHVIRASCGTAIGVSDEDTLDAMQLCASREAILPEPASACGIAAVKLLLESGWLKPEECAVSIVTGSGLRDLPRYGGDLSSTDSVRPDHPEDMEKALARFAD